MVLLEAADFFRDGHPRAEQGHELLVDDVDAGAELVDVIPVFLFLGVGFADDELLFQHPAQGFRRNLLGGVAQRGVRVAVRFDHQSVDAQVEGPLAERKQVFPAAAHMRRVGEKGEVGVQRPELDGDPPARVVAVGDGTQGGEAPVHHAQLPDAGLAEAFQRADPQADVRIDGVLDQHGDVGAAQRVGDFLHQERIGRGARADPYHVHLVPEAGLDVLPARHFGTDLQAELPPGLLEPGESLRPDAFEAARMRPGLPDAGPEHVDAEGGELSGRCEDLLPAFRGAGPGDHHGRRGREEAPFRYGHQFESVCAHFLTFWPLPGCVPCGRGRRRCRSRGFRAAQAARRG